MSRSLLNRAEVTAPWWGCYAAWRVASTVSLGERCARACSKVFIWSQPRNRRMRVGFTAPPDGAVCAPHTLQEKTRDARRTCLKRKTQTGYGEGACGLPEASSSSTSGSL